MSRYGNAYFKSFSLLQQAVNCVRFCFSTVCDFWLFLCLCIKYLWNRWTDLRQIQREDVFGPSLGRVRILRSKVKGQGHQGQQSHCALPSPPAATEWPSLLHDVILQRARYNALSTGRPVCGLCLVKHLQPVVSFVIFIYYDRLNSLRKGDEHPNCTAIRSKLIARLPLPLLGLAGRF